jgi:hypothetical protein
LTQITGLAEMFADREFSEAWNPGTFNEAEAAEVAIELGDD